MKYNHFKTSLILPFLITSCVSLNLTQEETEKAKAYFVGKHFGININCREESFYCKIDSDFGRSMCNSTCSFNTYQKDQAYQIKIYGEKSGYNIDTYHITDIEIEEGLYSNYLVAASDNPKNKNNIFKFSISNYDLKNKKFPVSISEEGYKEIQEQKKAEEARKLEEKKALEERNKKIIKIKNVLHSNGCNQYWNYVYGGKPFIDYLVNLKIDNDNQVYCQKNIYGMDIFVYVKSPHQERKGIGLIADNSDKTLYRKTWEESGSVYECNKILCEDPLNGIGTLETLFLFGLM